MPDKTTTPATGRTAPAAVVFTDETLRKAADLAAASYRPVWIGPSGEESTGESVDRHLEAAIAVLDQDGWIRAHSYTSSPSGTDLLPDDDSMTVKAMLRALLRWVRDESET